MHSAHLTQFVVLQGFLKCILPAVLTPSPFKMARVAVLNGYPRHFGPYVLKKGFKMAWPFKMASFLDPRHFKHFMQILNLFDSLILLFHFHSAKINVYKSKCLLKVNLCRQFMSIKQCNYCNYTLYSTHIWLMSLCWNKLLWCNLFIIYL